MTNLLLKNNRGSITVFMSIVLSSVFLITGIFTDAARLRLARAQIQRAGKTALLSMLAGYNNSLKDQYGLFGIYADNDSFRDGFEEYFSKNLNLDNQNFLYDYAVESVELEQPYNLENRAVFENQIMEFMKYRAPYEFASDLIKKVEGIKGISGGAKVYSKKLETDKKANSIGELQMFLEDKTGKINKFDITAKLGELKNKYLDQNSVYARFSQKLNELQKLYSGEKDRLAKDELMREISSVQNELSNIGRTKEKIKNAVIESIDQFKSLNSEAVESSERIVAQKGELLEIIDEELQDTLIDQNGIKELQESYGKSLLDFRNKIAQDNAGAIIDELEKNIINCEDLKKQIETGTEDFLGSLDQMFQTGGITYAFNKAGPSESEDEDNRGKAKQALQTAFDVKGDLKAIESEQLEQLPSRKTRYEEENTGWDGADFGNGEGISSQLDYLEGKESGLGQIASNITEQLYLTEYIMGIFKHGVPLLKDEENSRAYNLRSGDKTERDAFFTNYEVEYIINGNRDEAVNAKLVKAEILSIRLISNIMHIYADSSKMTRATALAAALSSWNAGLSTPLVETAVVFSWAMLEALYDLDRLGEGEKIPLFKTKEQWKTDLSGAVDEKKLEASDNDPLYLSYQDYLKIFLLLTDKDKKLARVQDLVQLNMGFSCSGFMLEDSWVFLKAQTAVSVKNLFAAFPSFTAVTRRNISRTYISENVFIGY